MTVVIPADSADERALWKALIELAERDRNWTLIGARMVELHAAEAGGVLTRLSKDADVLADARRPRAVRRVAEILLGAKFRLIEPSYMGVGHTFVRGAVEIDLLAPDHLGPRSEHARMTVQGARTVEVPGGRQALSRSERIRVRVGAVRGEIPRPDLLGAILIKARAVDRDDAPESQRSDLALLFSLVRDPAALATGLAGQERRWIRRRRELDDPDSPAWRALSREDAHRGVAALRQLAGWQR